MTGRYTPDETRKRDVSIMSKMLFRKMWLGKIVRF